MELKERLIKMALVHDIAETRTGDRNYVNRRYSAHDEKIATEDVLFGTIFPDFLDIRIGLNRFGLFFHFRGIPLIQWQIIVIF